MPDPMPVSNPVPKSTPKDVFLHLLSIVTLYGSVISFIALVWQYINTLYPDPLNYYYQGILNSIRWSASVLVVMYPVYVFLTWLINKEYNTNPERKDIKVRKWLVYLTLFLAAITLIIDVITLVYNLFGGELTARFVLKILAVLITAGAVFGYYYFDLRGDKIRKNNKIIAWIVSIIILAAIIGGFLLIGSPTQQRKISFDIRRTNDLTTIQSNIIAYWQKKGTLPANLNEMVDNISVSMLPTDPATNQPYTYSVVSDLSFQLCANFELPSSDNNRTMGSQPVPYSPFDVENSNWVHGAGQQCFTRSIDPQRYGVPPAAPVK